MWGDFFVKKRLFVFGLFFVISAFNQANCMLVSIPPQEKIDLQDFVAQHILVAQAYAGSVSGFLNSGNLCEEESDSCTELKTQFETCVAILNEITNEIANEIPSQSHAAYFYKLYEKCVGIICTLTYAEARWDETMPPLS